MENVKVTTFKEYQAAAMRTCTKESHNEEYMVLGLIGEAGEVANKVKKIIRDDHGMLTAERSEAILGELGDVMWYVAGLANMKDETPMIFLEYPDFAGVQAYVDDPANSVTANDYAAATMMLCNTAGEIANDQLSGYHVSADLSEVVLDLAIIGKMIGYNIQQICQSNIDKLTTRYNNNSIHGSGDGVENRG